MPRVAVTGIGVVCALGRDTGEFAEALFQGRSAIAPIEGIDISKLRFSQGAQVRGFTHSLHFGDREADFLDRFAQFAVVAAREAVSDAKIEWTSDLKASAAVITGSCLGGQNTKDAVFEGLYGRQLGRVSPLTISKVMANAGASHISMDFGITGPSYTFSTACSSAGHAIGHAFRTIKNGEAPLAIAGGSDAPFSWGLLKSWEAMRVISPDTCRPFSKGRTGMILGEGAAMFVLEPLEAARERGARVQAEIVGFGMSSDASHITQPSPAGAALAIRRALREAGMLPEQVGYINAHGTATVVNDVCEASAIRDVFGQHTGRIALSSTKSLHGHALGAAAALEAAATILALRQGILPPTANFLGPDPECDLDVIVNESRKQQVEHALSNSFAFGGMNAVLAFRAAL